MSSVTWVAHCPSCNKQAQVQGSLPIAVKCMYCGTWIVKRFFVPTTQANDLPPPTISPRTALEPTTKQPSQEELEEYLEEGGCLATDGCWVEPDGSCEHGHVSWLRYLGMI